MSLLLKTFGKLFSGTRSGKRNRELVAKEKQTAKDTRLSERLFEKARQQRAKARQNFTEARRHYGMAERRTSTLGIAIWASFSIGGLLYIMSSPVNTSHMGFTGGVDSFAQWILFYVDTLIKVITLNIPDLLGWNLSTIEVVSGFSRLTTMVLQLCITASVIDLAIHFWSSLFRESVYSGTTNDLFWNQRFSAAKGTQVIMERISKEVPYQVPDKVRLNDFVNVYTEYHRQLREKHTLLLDKLNVAARNIEHPEQSLEDLTELESLSHNLSLAIADPISKCVQQLREAHEAGELSPHYLLTHITILKNLIEEKIL
jgi:hypothetical protein